MWSYELQPGEAIDLSQHDFYRGFDTQALIQSQQLKRDPRFLQADSYQAPRQIRLGLKLEY